MREVSQLKPGDNVTLRVYANGQFRDVTMKVARAGDLPRTAMRIGGRSSGMPAIAPMPPMPADAGDATDAAVARVDARVPPIELEMGSGAAASN